MHKTTTLALLAVGDCLPQRSLNMPVRNQAIQPPRQHEIRKSIRKKSNHRQGAEGAVRDHSTNPGISSSRQQCPHSATADTEDQNRQSTQARMRLDEIHRRTDIPHLQFRHPVTGRIARRMLTFALAPKIKGEHGIPILNQGRTILRSHPVVALHLGKVDHQTCRLCLIAIPDTASERQPVCRAKFDRLSTPIRLPGGDPKGRSLLKKTRNGRHQQTLRCQQLQYREGTQYQYSI